MAISLPARGQRDWDDELNNALNQMDGSAEDAKAKANAAVSTANNALSIAQSVQGAVIGTANEATATFVTDEGPTRDALSATFAAKGTATRQVFGEHDDPLGVTTSRVPVVFTTHSDNPQTGVEQHFLGFSFYTGTPGPGVGSLQGGSSESVAFASPADMGTVVGFEGAGRANSDNNKTVDTVIGLVSTASAAGSVTVNHLVGLRAAGPLNDLGVGGAVVNAYSAQVHEPAVGTNRYAIHASGRTRLKRGTHANALEITTATNVLQWASDGALLTGYASDGASTRLILDPTDGAGHRIQSMRHGSGNHIYCTNFGTPVFAVSASGLVSIGGTETTTAPAAGGAAALPATPAGYVEIYIGGVSRKVAYY